MKIVILDRKTLGYDVSVDIFSKFGEVISYDTTKVNETKDRIKNADIILTNKVYVGKDELENSSVKLICVTATGMNNVDLEYTKEKNIEIKNVAGYSTSSVIQLAFSMIFYFVQKLTYYKKYVDEQNWQKSDTFTHIDVPFFELDNKRVGIIGLGEIGRDLAKKAKAFNCEVVYYSTSGQNTNSEYKSVTLEELLKTSDIISIHAPLNEKTKDLLGYKELNLIKEGAILLNLGRGGIINEADLAKILDEKDIFCGLDVVSKEPIEETNPLLKVVNKQRLLMTPHIAWASVEARKRLIEKVAKNIEDFLK
ncbi:D-2-hydroxyacid dehydrogenase [Aliarcobacter cibarius]|jgi:lactate dehydrogenase-like 2-hydroxyacid dehydrogenase|uniref:D-2-hydroxyacid dehydrogenase n=1 Tax=Aliarcobacter cibarius TaxID=255507 RepID=A0ABY2V606_9BACT|nr:D-2-hydroxyacid dehydrogenase [Aliarcobacter cibarius]QEZ89801.1 2-hydroxyacid dehydrogenase [Aliarcobacter cibarius]TLT01041.1 D-2-hydroxyacid dehydrogenase [Aliarcobacter cibarius]TLT01138.1 D-2-hydroxyacid dehydrogenase [Aliarcobacter cibarius]